MTPSLSMDSMDSFSTVVSDEDNNAQQQYHAHLFEIGEPDDHDFALVTAEPIQTIPPFDAMKDACITDIEIIEEEPLYPPKRRVSMPDQILGRVQKLLQQDKDLKYVPYNTGVTECNPSKLLRLANKNEPTSDKGQDNGSEGRSTTIGMCLGGKCQAVRDGEDEEYGEPCSPKKQRLGPSTHQRRSSSLPRLGENWSQFVASTPTAAPKLSVAPPAALKWGFKDW